MLALEIGLFAAVVALGVIGFYIGLSVGKERGYGSGYIAGQNAVIEKTLMSPKFDMRHVRVQQTGDGDALIMEHAKQQQGPGLKHSAGRWL